MMCRRKIYFAMFVIVPAASIFFFLSLLGDGVLKNVPTAMVDLDNSRMSRAVSRSLGAMENVDIQYRLNSYVEAMDKLNRGDIFGFFVIPPDFGKKTLSARQPEISYYCNMTYYVPATFAFKGFKTVAVSTSGAVVKTALVSVGADEASVGATLQPVVITQHPIGNPWLNYSYYLNSTFIPAMLQLLIFLMTAYTIGDEIKRGTSTRWLETAKGSMLVAVVGKLFPQWVVFSVWGVLMQSIMYRYMDFPMNGNLLNMISAMLLFVWACQGFALFFFSALPNLRLGTSALSLLGVLSFSLTGFSFPVSDMYGAIGIFSWIIPVRYYFLIYIDIALNGFPIYYARVYYAALLLFPLVGMSLLWRLKRVCVKPYYVP